MHEDNEKCNAGDKRDADKIQADSEPAHGAAEEVVGGLVGVQQLLISAGTREIKSQHILADSEEKRKLGKKKIQSPSSRHASLCSAESELANTGDKTK